MSDYKDELLDRRFGDFYLAVVRNDNLIEEALSQFSKEEVEILKQKSGNSWISMCTPMCTFRVLTVVSDGIYDTYKGEVLDLDKYTILGYESYAKAFYDCHKEVADDYVVNNCSNLLNFLDDWTLNEFARRVSSDNLEHKNLGSQLISDYKYKIKIRTN